MTAATLHIGDSVHVHTDASFFDGLDGRVMAPEPEGGYIVALDGGCLCHFERSELEFDGAPRLRLAPTVAPQVELDPQKRIAAAYEAHLAWRAAPGLSWDEQQYARYDHQSNALAFLVGWLEGLAVGCAVTPEKIAEAVEYAVAKANGAVAR